MEVSGVSSSFPRSQNSTGFQSGCPDCGTPIQYIENRGPGSVSAQPCGCRIGYIRARDLQRGDA
jgi:hypothetical protein